MQGLRPPLHRALRDRIARYGQGLGLESHEVVERILCRYFAEREAMAAVWPDEGQQYPEFGREGLTANAMHLPSPDELLEHLRTEFEARLRSGGTRQQDASAPGAELRRRREEEAAGSELERLRETRVARSKREAEGTSPERFKGELSADDRALLRRARQAAESGKAEAAFLDPAAAHHRVTNAETSEVVASRDRLIRAGVWPWEDRSE
jgi:hypothetical protein